MSEEMEDSQPRSKGSVLSKASAGSKAPKKGSEAEASPEAGGSFLAKNQQLFLVEFLIDTVNIDPSGFCADLMEGQTCVSLKFFSFPPMIICERDFDQNKKPGVDKIHFNSGKSLMFALSQKQCESQPPMVAELIVSKNVGGEGASERVDIGRIKVCMVQVFEEVYRIAKLSPEKLPASRSIKDCFMLTGKGKRTTGEIGVYIRLTCLGQNVVTEFQCGTDMKQDPVLFKNLEGKQVYQFTGKERSGEEETDEATGNREECGCVRPAARPNQRGGQGDAGHPILPAGRTSGSRACATDGRGILDAPESANRAARGANGSGAKHKGADFRTGNRGGGDKAAVAASRADNPDQNVFVLKTGDKGQVLDRGRMILEFRTPKQKILPKVLPPYHEDIGVQTDSPKKLGSKKKDRKK